MTGMSADKKVDYYVFNNGKDNGFIIVSGDDKAAPVLGWRGARRCCPNA